MVSFTRTIRTLSPVSLHQQHTLLRRHSRTASTAPLVKAMRRSMATIGWILLTVTLDGRRGKESLIAPTTLKGVLTINGSLQQQEQSDRQHWLGWSTPSRSTPQRHFLFLQKSQKIPKKKEMWSKVGLKTIVSLDVFAGSAQIVTKCVKEDVVLTDPTFGDTHLRKWCAVSRGLIQPNTIVAARTSVTISASKPDTSIDIFLRLFELPPNTFEKDEASGHVVDDWQTASPKPVRTMTQHLSSILLANVPKIALTPQRD
ncbi:hypothetical protein BLNAU_23617 [Blattamonas nauphoetae]|uniref:Uncharacterized protein n=1 Tax=Blattamonas nauphoetae TaxID=2049346 RepID=A0ABQ9WTW3_9EUKA|nr:hypothetical protein BLNAU_23617 [Blattamonas nauphoetae]